MLISPGLILLCIVFQKTFIFDLLSAKSTYYVLAAVLFGLSLWRGINCALRASKAQTVTDEIFAETQP